jgi:integrase
VLDSGGVQSLLEAARGDRLEALYHLALSTGLRQGELFALGWRSGVDLEAGEVRVRRTLSWIKGEGYTFAPPKNESSRRIVRLRPEAVLLLRVHRKRMLEERMMGARKAELGLVFCSTVGTPLRRQNVQRRNFKPLLERAGLPQEVRFHDLRHTFATLALSRGADVKTISHMLGHSSIRTTLDIYAHVLPQAQEDALKKLDGLFG